VSVCSHPTYRTNVLPSAADGHRCGWPLADLPAPPPLLASILVVASGRRFPVARADTLIGRSDLASPPFPDIDRAKDEPNRTVSRHPARLALRRGDDWLRIEDEARNPGEMERAPLATGVSIALSDGDRFTLGGVELQFEAGPPTPTPRPTTQLDGQA
jgi:pSer/pThr/pTyr-binding forkhead associated (FHA) protein